MKTMRSMRCILFISLGLYGADSSIIISDDSDRSQHHEIDDLHDIELAPLPELTAESLIPHLPLSNYLTRGEHTAVIKNILAREQTRNGRNNDYIVALQTLITKPPETRTIGLPIVVSEDNVRPAVNWLAQRVFKKELQILGRRLDRQKIITGVTNVGSWIIASGFACLIAYIGSLWAH